MDDQLFCDSCNTYLHQSYLSSHVEAYHVAPRREEVVRMTCGTCPYSSSAFQKNNLIQHCLITGHGIEDIKTDWKTYWVLEEARLLEIVKEGHEILKKNLEANRWNPPARPILSGIKLNRPSDEVLEIDSDNDEEPPQLTKSTRRNSESEPESRVNLSCQSQRVGKSFRLIPIKTSQSIKHDLADESNLPIVSLDQLNISSNMPPKPSRAEPTWNLMKREFAAPEPPTRGAQGQNESTRSRNRRIRLSQRPASEEETSSLACKLCSKLISFSENKSNNLIKAVGHTVTHVNFRAFQCRYCDYGTARGRSMREHIKHQHGQQFSSEQDYEIIASSRALKRFRDKIEEAFPTLEWNKNCNIISYL